MAEKNDRHEEMESNFSIDDIGQTIKTEKLP